MPATGYSTLNWPVGEYVEYRVDSGVVANADGDFRVVFQTVVGLEKAGWVRLYFGVASLDPGSFIRIISAFDGEVQELRADDVAMWRNTSAYFNGDTVSLELVAAPRTTRNQVSLDRVAVYFPPEGRGPCAGDNCGIVGADDRVPSAETWTGRIMPVGCTGSIYSPDSCVVSAGHCCSYNQDLVIQFNVPASGADCVPVNPPVADQFPITAHLFHDNGIGDDWAVMTTGMNNLGQTAYDRYAAAQPLALLPGELMDLAPVWGFGVDNDQPTRSQTQQGSTGFVLAVENTYYGFGTDVTYGNSGSALMGTWIYPWIIGVVTHCGYDGVNYATRIDVPDFVLARQLLCVSETVSAPNTPTGPTSLEVGEAGTYTTGGSSSNQGHPVEYRFDWGNGQYSTWGSATRSYLWPTAGSYCVRAQARCVQHPNVMSAWSGCLNVSVTGGGEVYLGEAITCEWVNGWQDHGPMVTEFTFGEEVHVYLEWQPTTHDFYGDTIGFKWYHDGDIVWEDEFEITEHWYGIWRHLWWAQSVGTGHIQAYWNDEYLGATNDYTVIGTPTICRQPTTLSCTCLLGENAPDQTFEVWNCGTSETTLAYTISDDATWLSCTPIEGTSTGEDDTITVQYETGGLSEGQYTATITIDAPEANNTPQTITVTLTVVGEGLVAYWTFDESSGSVAHDSSGYDNHGTICGASWTTGVGGSALSFDGQDDYVGCGNDGSLQITGAMTVSAWIKPALMQEKVFISKTSDMSACGNGWGVWVNDDGNLAAQQNSVPCHYDYRITTQAILTLDWQHVVVVFPTDGASRIRFYRNGIEITDLSGSGHALSSRVESGTDLQIGRFGSDCFSGGMDEVRIYNYLLSPGDVLALYQGACCQVDGTCSVTATTECSGTWQGPGTSCDPNPCVGACCLVLDGSCTEVAGADACASIGGMYVGDGTSCATADCAPVAYWPFDEGSGTMAHDLSGHGRDGTISGATWVAGVSGAALDFDGTNDYVSVPLSTTTTFTVAAWVNPHAAGLNSRQLLDKADEFIFAYRDGKLCQYTYQGDLLFSDTPLDPNDWSFVALVRTPSTASFYLDGQYDGGGATSPRDLTGTYSIGSRFGTQYAFDGTIDEVRIYNDALSAAEVLQLYESSLTGACCFGDGGCEIWSAGQCSAISGTYQGDWTTCSPNPCPQPGACCFADGHCELKTSAECTAPGGTFLGENTACDPNPCLGACCSIVDGSCTQEAGPDACASVGGTYAGDGTTCATVDCALVAYWPFDEGSGTITHDLSGHGRDGTISGATWVAGVSGAALDFDGTNDYVSVPVSTSTTVTVTAWINPHAAGPNSRQLLDKADSFIFAYRDGKLCQYTYQGDLLFSDTPLDPNDWSFVALVRTPSTASFYLDGQYDGSGATAPRSLTGTYSIGSRFGTQYAFDGTIDEVRIYSRALSAAEVLQLYESGLMGACCFADEICQVQSAGQCGASGGTYQGEGSSCDPNPCAEAVLAGDLNGDGSVDFGDINPFVLFLSNYGLWLQTYPGCPPENGDINGDGLYPDFGDINPFVALLSGS